MLDSEPPAANVTLSEAVPGLTTYVAAGSSAAWVCTGTAAQSACTAAIGSLPAGASTVLTYVVAIESPLPASAAVVTNQACAAAAGVPAACGAASIPTTGHASLHLVKSYTGGSVLPGVVLPFTLTASNTGNQDLAGAVLTETVPALASFDAGASDARWSCAGVAAGSSCTLELGSLPAGASQAVAFAVRAALALPAAAVIANAACVTGVPPLTEAAAGGRRRTAPGTALGTALGTAPGTALEAALRQLRRGARPAQLVEPQACGSVETPPALAIDTTLAAAVVGHGAPAMPGDRIHYTLTVPNGTAETLTALLATASLDGNTALVAGSVTASQGAVTTGNGAGDATVVVALGDLAAGGTATVGWEVTVDAHLPPGLTQVAAQVETTGGNIPPDESGPPPAPSTPGPSATPVTAGTAPPPPPPPQAIPTLGQWGVGSMIALLGGTATLVMRRRRSGAAES